MPKIIRTSKDIVNKIEKGIKFSDYQTVYRGSIKISGDDFDPLLFTREKSEMDFNLLRLTYKRGYINIMDFTLSRFYIVLYKILHVVKDVTSSRLRHWRFSDSSTIDGYSTITCSKGIDRAKTYLLSKDMNYDVPLEICRNNFHLKDRINVIKMMLGYRTLSYWHVAQFYILKKEKPHIIADTLIMEEGGDFVGQCFKFLFSENVLKTVLTISTPFLTPSVKYNYDSIIVNNEISYRQLSLVNPRVTLKGFPPNVDIAKYKPYKARCIGYAPDIGNPVLSLHKKSAMDKKFFENVIFNGYSTCLTVHPQDNSDTYSKYIKSGFLTLRNGGSLESYLSRIDILVTWWSSLIFQALYCGIPVIVLDLFDDGHSDHVSNLTDDFVRTVKTIPELNVAINEFRNYSFDEKKLKHENAMRKVYPLSEYQITSSN
jgi:hypothetical protein